MSVPELACIGITRDSMANAIKGSHRGWLFEEAGEVCGFAMGNVAKALGSIAKASRKLAEARGLPEDLAHNGH